jgi:hypothetical protein
MQALGYREGSDRRFQVFGCFNRFRKASAWCLLKMKSRASEVRQTRDTRGFLDPNVA